MMEDGIDSKKGRPQLQTEGKERETTLRFSPQIIAFYSDIGEKEHRNSRTPARLQGSKHKKSSFSPRRTKKTPSPSRRRRYALRVFREWTEN
jgi:hypothetical protein